MKMHVAPLKIVCGAMTSVLKLVIFSLAATHLAAGLQQQLSASELRQSGVMELAENPSWAPYGKSSRGSAYECAREVHLNSTCACNGYVKFGHGSSWTPWMNVSEQIECASGLFGDPIPGVAKSCICQPRSYVCASEWGKHGLWANCTDEGCEKKHVCKCEGYVRYGYETRWTDWRAVDGKITCSDKVFGDPFEGHGKVCECQPERAILDKMLEEEAPAGGKDYAPMGPIPPCIVAIVLCYFIVYGSLAMCRCAIQVSSNYNFVIDYMHALAGCTSSVYLAPMLCVIIFAVTKRAETLTAGSPGTYGYPPVWLGIFCIICATAFCFQVGFHFLAEYHARKASRDPTGSSSRQQRQWRLLNEMVFAVTYLFVVLILIGITLMKEPTPVIKAHGKVPVAPGTVCTIGLAVVYFSVYLVLHCLKMRDLSWEENDRQRRLTMGGETREPENVQYTSWGTEVMSLAANAVALAPMLAAVFMGAQIAADWLGVGISGTVEVCIYVCTFSIFVQVIIILLTPYVSQAQLEVKNGEVNFVTRNIPAYILISFVRWTALAALYIGVLVLCARLWMFKAAPNLTHYLARLAIIYFGSYLVLWIVINVRLLRETGLKKMLMIMYTVKDTVVFCPMLAILALLSFVRARHLINLLGQPGIPQGYVQDYMYVALCALFVQILMTLLSGVVNLAPVSATSNADEDPPRDLRGEPVKPIRQVYYFCFMAIYCIATVVLFFSVFVVCYGLFTITRRNATGNDAWFV